MQRSGVLSRYNASGSVGRFVHIRGAAVMYQARHYRKTVDAGRLVSFAVTVGETDLLVLADSDLQPETRELIKAARAHLQAHIAQRPEFVSSLRPLDIPAPEAADEKVAEMIAAMYRASQIAGTGPMAAVAGAVAEAVGQGLLTRSRQVIVENGGDIFIKSDVPRTVSIYAGESPLSTKVGIRLPAGRFGVCTSSGMVGHSFSMGKADAAVAISADTALADAVATALGNRIECAEDIAAGLEWVQGIEGILHAAIIVGDRFGTWGQFEIVPIANETT